MVAIGNIRVTFKDVDTWRTSGRRASSVARRTSGLGIVRPRTLLHTYTICRPVVRTLAPHLHPICAPALGRATLAQLYPNPLPGIYAWSAREDGPRPLVEPVSCGAERLLDSGLVLVLSARASREAARTMCGPQIVMGVRICGHACMATVTVHRAVRVKFCSS